MDKNKIRNAVSKLLMQKDPDLCERIQRTTITLEGLIEFADNKGNLSKEKIFQLPFLFKCRNIEKMLEESKALDLNNQYYVVGQNKEKNQNALTPETKEQQIIKEKNIRAFKLFASHRGYSGKDVSSQLKNGKFDEKHMQALATFVGCDTIEDMLDNAMKVSYAKVRGISVEQLSGKERLSEIGHSRYVFQQPIHVPQENVDKKSQMREELFIRAFAKIVNINIPDLGKLKSNSLNITGLLGDGPLTEEKMLEISRNMGCNTVEEFFDKARMSSGSKVPSGVSR